MRPKINDFYRTLAKKSLIWPVLKKWHIRDFWKITLFYQFSQILECPLFGVLSVLRKFPLKSAFQADLNQQEFTYHELIITIVCACIFVFGVLGNGLTLWVLLRSGRWRKNTTNMFIVSLTLVQDFDNFSQLRSPICKCWQKFTKTWFTYLSCKILVKICCFCCLKPQLLSFWAYFGT